MLEAVLLNFSLNFFITFTLFQLYFRYKNLITSSFIKNATLGVGFGIAQFIYFYFPIYTDYSTQPMFIGGTTFITAAVFGGGTASFIASMIPYIMEFLIYGVLPLDMAILARIIIGNIIIGISFAFIHLERWKIWLLLNILFHFNLFFMVPGLRVDFVLIRSSLEIICSAIIYYLVLHLLQAHEAKRKLELSAITDPLTGLHNVRFFKKSFHKLFSDAQKDKLDLTIMIVDIDFFKMINDNYGHLVGDQVLIEVARILEETFREYGLISRNGGEEFSVLLSKMSKEEAIVAANQFRQYIEQHSFLVEPYKSPLHLTVSIGLAFYSKDYTTSEQFFTSADKALYRAKQSGRNRVCTTSFSMLNHLPNKA